MADPAPAGDRALRPRIATGVDLIEAFLATNEREAAHELVQVIIVSRWK